MKLSQAENKLLSTAIDKITEGLDEVIELYNESVEDKPLIIFSEDVNEGIKKAIQKYGDDHVNRKINTLVGEMLDWLPLEDVELDKEEETEEDNKGE